MLHSSLCNKLKLGKTSFHRRSSSRLCCSSSLSPNTARANDRLAQALEKAAILQDARLLHTQTDPIPTAASIKTMVLVQQDLGEATTQPGAVLDVAATAARSIAVLLLSGHRVDLRAVAQHLAVPRTAIRLATAEEAEALTGYQLGCIPPLGHKHPLRTLVDAHIVQQPAQQVWASGGAADVQLVLPAQQLLAGCAGEPGAFSTLKQALPEAPQQQGSSGGLNTLQQQQQQQQQQPPAGMPSFLHLPQPWSEGAEEVELVGVLAQRRRIAKLLLFATLVPESVPALPLDGTAAYVRRLWRHPAADMPCEVQLIMGKTIERQLGREGAAGLFDKLKVGAVVALRGRVQQHPQPTAAAPPGSNGSSSRHQSVLDVVVQEIQVLAKNRDALARAVTAAQRQGHTGVQSARDLQQLQAGQGVADSSANQGALGSVAAGGAAAVRTPGRVAVQMPAEVPTPAATAGAEQLSSAAGAAAAASAAHTKVGNSRQQAAVNPVSQQQEQQQYYTFALGLQGITFVQDMQGVLDMHQAVLGQRPTAAAGAQGATSPAHSSSSSSSSSSDGSNGSSSSSNGGGSSSSVAVPVVGLDCEWQPYERGAQRTPVALLQLATRERVFVIDMLAICRQQQQQQQQEVQPTAASSSAVHQPHCAEGQPLQAGSTAQGAAAGVEASATLPSSSGSSSSTGSSSSACTPVEQALACFLQQLFSHGGIKVLGFGLLGDLRRLAVSYPQLLHPQPAPEAASAADRTPSIHAGSASSLPAGASTIVVTADAPSTAPGVDPDPDPMPAEWVVHQAVELQQLSVVVDPGSWQKGLSEVVSRSLGQGPLNKEQQASNWAARPLSEQQLLYAATDAHVLTVLYDELLARLGS